LVFFIIIIFTYSLKIFSKDAADIPPPPPPLDIYVEPDLFDEEEEEDKNETKPQTEEYAHPKARFVSLSFFLFFF
jgi:hypothetical protein